MDDITRLLEAARTGGKDSRDRLYSAIYAELHALARAKLARMAPITVLDAPALVNEAYLRLARQTELPGRDRGALFAYAASAMRSVVVDHLRARSAERRGGDPTRVTLSTGIAGVSFPEPDVEALESALVALEQVDERACRVVELRFYAGLEVEEVAVALAISTATVKRDWRRARAFLYHQLRGVPAAAALVSPPGSAAGPDADA